MYGWLATWCAGLSGGLSGLVPWALADPMMLGELGPSCGLNPAQRTPAPPLRGAIGPPFSPAHRADHLALGHASSVGSLLPHCHARSDTDSLASNSSPNRWEHQWPR